MRAAGTALDAVKLRPVAHDARDAVEAARNQRPPAAPSWRAASGQALFEVVR
jgi:hypothetical protein